MTDLVLTLPTWAGIAVAMLLATVAGFLVYAITHRFISPGLRDDLKTATGSLLAG